MLFRSSVSSRQGSLLLATASALVKTTASVFFLFCQLLCSLCCCLSICLSVCLLLYLCLSGLVVLWSAVWNFKSIVSWSLFSAFQSRHDSLHLCAWLRLWKSRKSRVFSLWVSMRLYEMCVYYFFSGPYICTLIWFLRVPNGDLRCSSDCLRSR